VAPSPQLVQELLGQVGEKIELTFSDGFIAQVRPILVQPDEEPLGLVYDLIKVVAFGSMDAAVIDWSSAHAASIEDVVSWRAIRQDAT
jgi:hypothetical protein